jgi:hypothetical protein
MQARQFQIKRVTHCCKGKELLRCVTQTLGQKMLSIRGQLREFSGIHAAPRMRALPEFGKALAKIMFFTCCNKEREISNMKCIKIIRFKRAEYFVGYGPRDREAPHTINQVTALSLL